MRDFYVENEVSKSEDFLKKPQKKERLHHAEEEIQNPLLCHHLAPFVEKDNKSTRNDHVIPSPPSVTMTPRKDIPPPTQRPEERAPSLLCPWMASLALVPFREP
ncbi:hypothetical protein ACLOJK_029286 [Asimina triloba]